MDARTLLDRLHQAGVTVTTDQDQLVCRPASAIPPTLRALVAARKPDIVALLTQQAARPAWGFPAQPRQQKTQPPNRLHPWLNRCQVAVRMAPPAPGEDATKDTSLGRRADYYRALWAGTAPEPHLERLAPGTCLVCGIHPIAERGRDFRCELCQEACDLVVAERRQDPHASFVAAALSVFEGSRIDTDQAEFRAYRDMTRQHATDLSYDDRLEPGLEVLARILSRLIELGDTIGEARARAVWDRLEAIADKRRTQQ